MAGKTTKDILEKYRRKLDNELSIEDQPLEIAETPTEKISSIEYQTFRKERQSAA